MPAQFVGVGQERVGDDDVLLLLYSVGDVEGGVVPGEKRLALGFGKAQREGAVLVQHREHVAVDRGVRETGTLALDVRELFDECVEQCDLLGRSLRHAATVGARVDDR
ncbi:hypothetical protein [Kribbella sp. NPDC049227]|uniref:hypothetical protein n=1 Tax=Kribbella sp. NPDC049227 TaxID=3364113 RepID=UPI003716511A